MSIYMINGQTDLGAGHRFLEDPEDVGQRLILLEWSPELSAVLNYPHVVTAAACLRLPRGALAFPGRSKNQLSHNGPKNFASVVRGGHVVRSLRPRASGLLSSPQAPEDYRPGANVLGYPYLIASIMYCDQGANNHCPAKPRAVPINVQVPPQRTVPPAFQDRLN